MAVACASFLLFQRERQALITAWEGVPVYACGFSPLKRVTPSLFSPPGNDALN